MRIIFISGSLNHHQIPLSEEIIKLVGIENYTFIATTRMSSERIKMGFQDIGNSVPYVTSIYDQKDLINVIKEVTSADIVIWGGIPRAIAKKLLKERIKKNKIIFRYSERIFKRGMWRAMTPARIAYMLLLHTRYRKKPIYMLSASAYLPYELNLFKAYPNKIFRWGYFPPFIQYDIDTLIARKPKDVVKILWVGRLISWKHPEYAIYLAKRLVESGVKFEIEIIGTGALENQIKEMIKTFTLEEYVYLSGSMSPEKVRNKMENAKILLATSDYNEGWGAVINEGMNSGCVVIASHAMGSVPFLIKNKENGLIFKNGDINNFYATVSLALQNEFNTYEICKNAYLTIQNIWNAHIAAKNLINLYHELENGSNSLDVDGPCDIAPIISQHKMYSSCLKEKY